MTKKTTDKKTRIRKTRTMSRSWDNFMHDELTNPAQAQAYLEVAIEEFQDNGDVEHFLEALRYLAKARGGMAEVARKTGLSRESLYRTLSQRGNPRFRTVLGVINALGMRFRVEPSETQPV